jgi:predicted TIM-barrel fold metal-dependent hydrolase
LTCSTDIPFDPEEGPGYVRETLAAIHTMDLTVEERRRILNGNAERLFVLTDDG